MPTTTGTTGTPTLDARDRQILTDRQAALDAAPGPRVGDVVRFPDGTQGRFSHDWHERGLQTSPGGSFYLGDGYVSFSGSLDRIIPRDALSDTGQTRQVSAWFFHHDHARAQGGIPVTYTARVFASTADRT